MTDTYDSSEDFNNKMSEDTLKKKAVNGITWSAIDKISLRGMNFLIGIIIARILMPADYGVIGMVAVFITLSNLFADSGFSQALVQKQDRSQTDMSTAFFFSLLVAVGCYALLFIIAPFIAAFYDMPILSSILRVIGLNVILMSLATVQRANLYIKIDFRTLTIIDILSVILSGTIGIIMANRGFGVWSLVVQQLTMQGSSSLWLWILGNWRPTWEFSRESVVRLWKFGSKLLAAGTVATCTREIYSIVIGKYYRSAELGFYHRAMQTTDVISGTFNEIINTASFPILSSIQDDRERLVSAYSRLLTMTAFIVFPIMTLLAVMASPLVSTLLTDKWLPAVPLIQWLCFARMLTPISSLNMNILNAIGRSDLFLKIDLSKLPLTILTMVITLPISVKAVVIGNFICTFICYFINAYMPGRLFNFGVKAQFKIFYKTLFATAIRAVVAGLAMRLSDLMIVKLILGSCAGIIAYLLMAATLKMSELKDILVFIRKNQ